MSNNNFDFSALIDELEQNKALEIKGAVRQVAKTMVDVTCMDIRSWEKEAEHGTIYKERAYSHARNLYVFAKNYLLGLEAIEKTKENEIEVCWKCDSPKNIYERTNRLTATAKG